MNFSTTFDERRLLVTDLDGTLLGGSKPELKKLQQALNQEKESIVLVYVFIEYRAYFRRKNVREYGPR